MAMSSSLRSSCDRSMLKRARPDALIEHVVVAGSAGLDQRILRACIGLGLQAHARAQRRVVGIDVRQVGQLVGVELTLAIAPIGIAQRGLFGEVGCTLIEVGQGQLLSALELA